MDWDRQLEFDTNLYNDKYDCDQCRDGVFECTCLV